MGWAAGEGDEVLVPDLTAAGLLAGRRRRLLNQLSAGWDGAPVEVRSFAARLVLAGASSDEPIASVPGPEVPVRDLARRLLTTVPAEDAVAYGGAPEVAAAGYALGAGLPGLDAALMRERFRDGIARLRARSKDGRPGLVGNQILLLGLSDGVAAMRRDGTPQTETATWLADLLAAHTPADASAHRLRDLALDLLDARGRIRASIDAADPEVVAVDVALRETWPAAFGGTAPPDAPSRALCLRRMVIGEPPAPGDLGQAAVAWCALEVLTQASVAALAPQIDTLVAVLQRTQTALRRWSWDVKPRTRNAPLAQWRLDNEYHVQGMLWAVLYPIYGGALRDEEYLESFGLTQGRLDLAITTLRAIIEVKFIRRPSDFADIEEQVAGDLGLYFANPARFDHVVVYVYDDADDHQPEEYARLRQALLNRDVRVRDAVIVRRPGQIPPRAERFGRGSPTARPDAAAASAGDDQPTG